MNYTEQIIQNNAHNTVSKEEVATLITQAKTAFSEHHSPDVHFERSVFINWTCGIADCKYCYLSTQPKQQENAIRHPDSILAEIALCKLMGWKVGYITGGLRVESNEYIAHLLQDIVAVLGEQTMMNFGPYAKSEIELFQPYVKGMGSAIESFDEALHNFICPSKPLSFLKRFLGHLDSLDMEKLITIILGVGEKKEDIAEVIKAIQEYNITCVQLCFLKPQAGTIFSEVPSPNADYMSWWIAKLRIACPTLQIKVALVDDRIEDVGQYLDAGANAFTRFHVFKLFGTDKAHTLEQEVNKAGRTLQGFFSSLPAINLEKMMLPFSEERNATIKKRVQQYLKRLERKIISYDYQHKL